MEDEWPNRHTPSLHYISGNADDQTWAGAGSCTKQKRAQHSLAGGPAAQYSTQVGRKSQKQEGYLTAADLQNKTVKCVEITCSECIPKVFQIVLE